MVVPGAERVPRRALPVLGSVRVPGPPALWAVLALALVLRGLTLLLTPDYAPFGDAADYDTHGVGLSVIGTYPPTTFGAPGTPAALRPPGYPYWLGAIYDVTGMRFLAARGAAVVLGVVSVGLVHEIARRLWDGRTALWCAGVAAVVPTLVWLPAGLVAETLFVPLVLAAVLCVLLHRDAPRRWWPAAAGALCAAAALTRSNGLIVLLPVLAGLAVAARARPGAHPGRRAIRDVAIALGCAVLVLVPWTVRNEEALHATLPLGTQSGFTMAGAWNADAAKSGDYFAAWRVPMDLPEFQDLVHQPGKNEADVDASLRSRALTYAGDHPGYVARATAVHLGQLFELGPHRAFVSGLSYHEMGIPGGWSTPVRLGLWALLLLAVAGVVVGVRRPGPRTVPLWLWAVPVLLLLSVVPLLGAPRYRVPLDPFLALPAGVACLAAWDRLRAARDRRPTTSAV